MRHGIVWSVAILGWTGLVWAQNDDDPRAIVARAAKAMGQDPKTAHFEGMRSRLKGKLEIGGGLQIQQEVLIRYPNQFKETVELEVNNMKIQTSTVYNGKVGWVVVNGMVMKLDEKITKELAAVGQLVAVGRLTNLLDKKYKLSRVGEIKVLDQPAIGIRVEAQGIGEFNLFFDKKTYLMVKMERRALDPMADKEIVEERIVQKYRKKDGQMVPEKILVLRDGKSFLEGEVLEFTPLEKVDPAEFAMPQ